MYISKNDLIKRLVLLTGKNRSEFITLTVKELSAMYEKYISKEKRTYIEVPYKDKNIAKILGARYDAEKKKWYVPKGVDLKIFKEWI